MDKRTNKWTEEKIARYHAEGRGSGELSNYKPWLTIQDFPSKVVPIVKRDGKPIVFIIFSRILSATIFICQTGQTM